MEFMKLIKRFSIFDFEFSFEYLKLSAQKRYDELRQIIRDLPVNESDEALGEAIKIGEEWNL